MLLCFLAREASNHTSAERTEVIYPGNSVVGNTEHIQF